MRESTQSWRESEGPVRCEGEGEGIRGSSQVMESEGLVRI